MPRPEFVEVILKTIAEVSTTTANGPIGPFLFHLGRALRVANPILHLQAILDARVSVEENKRWNFELAQDREC